MVAQLALSNAAQANDSYYVYDLDHLRIDSLHADCLVDGSDANERALYGYAGIKQGCVDPNPTGSIDAAPNILVEPLEEAQQEGLVP